MSPAAHALVHGEPFDDAEVARATLEAEKLIAQLNDAHPRLGAYSDGGVAGSGAPGLGAAIIRFGDTDATPNIRLIPIGRRLSSGRAEWVGLLLILAVLRRVKATVRVRLDKIQVASAYNDGQWAYERNLLRRNDRDLSLMCWNLMAARERDGLGGIEAKHQKGHAERRKQRTEFDIHEIYNDKVDRATHTVRDGATAYVSFAPLPTDRTGVWYDPLEAENVGEGTTYEVTSGAYRRITLASQRRTANEHTIEYREGRALPHHVLERGARAMGKRGDRGPNHKNDARPPSHCGAPRNVGRRQGRVRNVRLWSVARVEGRQGGTSTKSHVRLRVRRRACCPQTMGYSCSIAGILHGQA